MFNYDEKRFFNPSPVEGCCLPPRQPQSFPEKVEVTSRMLRDTLDRLMMFEKTMKEKYDDLFSIMTNDNVTFKKLMEDAYSDFVSSVRTEINLFETNTTSVVTLFKEAINARLTEFNENYSQAFADYQKELAEYLNTFEDTIREEFNLYKTDVNNIIAQHVARFDAQDAKIDDAVAYMKTNLNATLANLLNEMEENGSLVGVIDSDVLTSVKQYGAIGDGNADEADVIKTAIEFGKPIFFPEGTYKIGEDIYITQNDVNIMGKNAVIDLNGHRIVFGNTDANVTIDNIRVDGITFKNGYVGVSRVNGFNFTDCKFITGDSGLRGSHSYVGVVENCEFNGCTNGILFDKDILSANANPDHNAIYVRNNRFYNNTNPFIIRGGFVGCFENNQVEGNANGIVIEGMSDYRIHNNYFEYNTGTIITLNNCGEMLNHAISIGQNRIFGDSSGNVIGIKLTGTIMGLYLETNSWGGLGTLIANEAILSRPMLLSQVNNTGLAFPNFPNNFVTLDKTLIFADAGADPVIIAGRVYAKNNSLYAQTKIGDYVLNHKVGYVPTLNVTPTDGDNLIYTLPDGRLCIKINGVEKTFAFTN